MKKIAEITLEEKKYKIDLNKFYDLSIPISMDSKSPSFYDKKPLKIKYYKDRNGKVWNLNEGSSCNVPVIDLNIHCGSTHSECRSHITKENIYISDILDNSFISCLLISLMPQNELGNDSYHYNIDSNDFIIDKLALYNKLNNFKNSNIKALVVRTLPNDIDEIILKNYDNDPNCFFSNEAIKYLVSFGIEHLIVDTPSIDKINDGGTLGNHKIFWDLNKKGNKNTITELAIIKNEINDGQYLLCLNILNLRLDASPSRPLIYPILK